jgi:predicted deacylase
LLEITPVDRIDWESPGARRYAVPFTMDGTWGRMRLPLYVACATKSGSTVVAIGGTHGDEYEGPVAFKNLVHDLDPAELVAGRLIVVPVLNVPAFRAARRESPVDGVNMNRAFPGDPRGTLTSRIAHFVTTEVLGRADVVIDIHSGGASMEIVRTMSFHAVPDPGAYRRFEETALLFGTPFVMIYTSGMGTGLLTEEAEAMGKVTIGSELGFGASTDLQGVRWAYRGLRNVMKHYGLLAGRPADLRPPGWTASGSCRRPTSTVGSRRRSAASASRSCRSGRSSPRARGHRDPRLRPLGRAAGRGPRDGDGYVLQRKFARRPSRRGRHDHRRGAL